MDLQQSLAQSIIASLPILMLTPWILYSLISFLAERSVKKQEKIDAEYTEMDRQLRELRQEQAEIHKKMAAELESSGCDTEMPSIDLSKILCNIETQMQEVEYWNKKLRRRFLTTKQRDYMRGKCWPYIENITNTLMCAGLPTIEIAKATPYTRESIIALLGDRNKMNQTNGR